MQKTSFHPVTRVLVSATGTFPNASADDRFPDRSTDSAAIPFRQGGPIRGRAGFALLVSPGCERLLRYGATIAIDRERLCDRRASVIAMARMHSRVCRAGAVAGR
jgi:hypothetical protein